jgi:NADH:ubiquinone oxidoreductase subunit K
MLQMMDRDLFVLGVLGIFLNRKNVIVILMSVELILLAVNLNFVAFSAHLQDLQGQVFALLILTVVLQLYAGAVYFFDQELRKHI